MTRPVTKIGKFNAWCREQEQRDGCSPDNRSRVRSERVASCRPVFDHSFAVERICLWTAFRDLRTEGGTPAEFGIVAEPYAFEGNDAQQEVARRWGFKFYRLREKGFHGPGAKPYLWIVTDLSKAGGVVQELLPDWPLGDLYGLADAGQTLTVVSDRDRWDGKVLQRFCSELEEAGRLGDVEPEIA